jgi:hypothetical protein
MLAGWFALSVVTRPFQDLVEPLPASARRREFTRPTTRDLGGGADRLKPRLPRSP